MSFRELLFRLLFRAEYEALCERPAELRREREQRLRAQELASEVSQLRGRLGRYERRPRFDRTNAWSEEQLADVLAGTGSLPVVKAVMDVLDRRILLVNDAAIDPDLSDGKTKFYLGAADGLIGLKTDLQERTERERADAPAQS